MKKVMIFSAIAAMVLSSCADSKTFKKADGTEFTAQPYGWMNESDYKIDGVQYEICDDNIVLCKPGITGAWQVSPMHNRAFKYRCEMESLYYKNMSFFYDLRIFLNNKFY